MSQGAGTQVSRGLRRGKKNTQICQTLNCIPIRSFVSFHLFQDLFVGHVLSNNGAGAMQIEYQPMRSTALKQEALKSLWELWFLTIMLKVLE